MGLVKIQNALKKLKVEFEYEEINGLSKINFLDDKGEKHIVAENYYYNSNKLYLDNKEMMKQKEVCNWIEENELLLTDYEKLKSNLEKRKKEIEKEEFDRAIIETLKFEKGGYLLEILTTRVGRKGYYFNRNNSKKDYDPELFLGGISYKRKTPLVVNIRAVSTHDMNVDETYSYIEGLNKAIETVNYFNEILKPYDKLRKEI